MTARELVNNVKIDDSFVNDSLNAAISAASDRINGKMDNEAYKKRIEEIRKNLEAKKQQEKQITAIKPSQGVQIGSNSVGSGVSAPVQNKV